MTTKPKKIPTIKDFIENRSLRKQYRLFNCPKGAEHLFALTTPHGIIDSVYNWYSITHDYVFIRANQKKTVLFYQCLYCHRSHTKIADICTYCRKAIKPITKKLQDRIITNVKIRCLCPRKK